jgi:hypothetical protein
MEFAYFFLALPTSGAGFVLEALNVVRVQVRSGVRLCAEVSRLAHLKCF